VSDSWEREGEAPQYFLTFSIYGYQTAINVPFYAMTHDRVAERRSPQQERPKRDCPQRRPAQPAK
jgi:hypothetical protein